MDFTGKAIKLFAEESAIVFADGKVFKGAQEVGGYVVRVVESSVTLGLKKGLKIGFVGGVIVTGCAAVAARKYYKPKKLKE